jgi:hypothetical protein
MGKARSVSLGLLLGLLAACVSPATPSSPTPSPGLSPSPVPSPSLAFSPSPAPSPTPQPHQTPRPLGPEREDFPPGVNPLTGLPVSDPALLEQPAALISISNMPVTTRPQAGLQFASWVFELFIGEGSTRFLAIFYGEYPRYIPNVPGDCPLRAAGGEPGKPAILGRVWLDENENGRLDPWEAGVGGVCLHLYNAQGERLQSTSSDSNGYYFFNLPSAGAYRVGLSLPGYYRLTKADQGTEEGDSDAHPQSGMSALQAISESAFSLDFGLILHPEAAPLPTLSITPTPPRGMFHGKPMSGRSAPVVSPIITSTRCSPSVVWSIQAPGAAFGSCSMAAKSSMALT